MAKFVVEVAVPEGLQAGDLFEVEVETPAAIRKPRGQLAGMTVQEMSVDQLKREKINASSVLYKATKRGAPDEILAVHQARLDAVKAEIDVRKGASTVEEIAAEDTHEEVAQEI